MCYLFRSVTAATAVMAVALAASTSFAVMEATATRKGAEANVANDIKLGAVTSTLTTLYNDLKDVVDGFAADIASLKTRVTALETWRTGTVTPKLASHDTDLANIKTKQPSVWNSPLETRLKAIEKLNGDQTTAINGKAATATVTALDARVKNIETKQPVSWNTALENRIKAIEAAKGKLSLVYKTSYSASSNGSATSGVHDLCVLSYASFGTTEDNHGHSCKVTKSGTKFVLAATVKKASTSCQMMCYNFE